jgi:hypothetical protein
VQSEVVAISFGQSAMLDMCGEHGAVAKELAGKDCVLKQVGQVRTKQEISFSMAILVGKGFSKNTTKVMLVLIIAEAGLLGIALGG